MLTYELKGRGNPVVLLHAFPLCGKMWQPQMEALSSFAQVIVPDLPGFGKSARQKEPSIPGMAQSVAELLDHLKIPGPVFVGGLSMGGYVAMEFLRQFPGRVRALGFFSTRAAADSPEAREKRMKTIEFIRAKGLGAFVPSVIPNLLGKTTLESKPAVVEKVKQLILKNSSEGVADSLLAMAGRKDSTDLLTKVRVPVLVAAGTEDLFIPFAESKGFCEKIPGAKFAEMRDSGHVLNLEDPEKFNAELTEFLKK